MGSWIGTGVDSGMPTRSPSRPPLTASVSTPKAAALAKRFMTTAFSGTRTERKTIIRSRKDMSSTPPKNSGNLDATPSVVSTFAGTTPPRSTVRPVSMVAAGMASSRSNPTRFCVSTS